MSALSNHRVLGPATVVAATGICCGAVLLGDPTTPGGVLPMCPTKLMFNVTCPGCGSQRALYSLLHGDLSAALHYNAAGVAAIGLLLFAFGAYCLRLWTGRRIRSWQNMRYSAVVVLVVVLIWFVVRNIPVEPFWSLHV
ncbi:MULTISPECIES: DUF2752 domain-containing protein [Gordonia]|uniref:DUF2752 domain-containing protein n=1 Tax=Gordonia TaxID=2053 RepID=UPI000464E290|nr:MULTISPECIES: DUF2752 domain-containing protein [Gordonia]MCR8896710.1 DUF2752 domain-containing protein [Gordonia sp. GONU]MCZ0911573.1 DUF2752 domain-containing protein [Gordonia amicalis]MCZ4649914.1 DUF2752 domain-containing protein [Gordonia amicalis]